MEIKFKLLVIISTLGSAIAGLFGGWDAAMSTLLIFMGLDILTGLIVAAVFKKSSKTEGGRLSSKEGFKGLCRKFVILFFVLIAHRLDLLMGVDYIKDFTIIFFCVNETISIIENAGTMGLPIPPIIQKAIEVLNSKSNEKEIE